MDQRALVERAKQGDHDAFAVLADMHVARLDAAARLILRDPDLARDAVQEGFIRAWRSLPTLRDPDALRRLAAQRWSPGRVSTYCDDAAVARSRSSSPG